MSKSDPMTRSDKSRVLFVGAIIAFLFALFPLIGSILFSQSAQSPEPPLPPWVPEDFPMMYGTQEAGERAYFVRCCQEVQLTVEFEERNSVSGLWSGSNPTFEIIEPYNQEIAAMTRQETWDNMLVSNVDTIKPWIKASMFVDQKYYHTWISASASVDVVYPERSGATFSNVQEHQNVNVRLYVISDQDIEMQNAYDGWEKSVAESSSFWGLWGLPLFFLGISFLLIVAGTIFKTLSSRK
jgi:hypothetical protein